MVNKIIKNLFISLALLSVFHSVLAENIAMEQEAEPEKKIKLEVEKKIEPVEEGVTKYTDKINELVKLGVPGLALRFVDNKQPAFEINKLAEWLWWEQKRIQLLQRLQRWTDIIQRVNNQHKLWSSDEVASYDKNWFLIQRVKAHQKLKQYQIALSQLQNLLWNIDAYVSTDTISIWRRLVIRNYMDTGKIEDAQRAMRRYLQDYGSVSDENNSQWNMLQAQLLMRTGRFQEVIQLLSHAATIEEESLLLIAKIKASVISAESVALQVSEKLLDESVSEEQHTAYYYALLLSAIKNHDLILQIEALENLLSSQNLSYLETIFADVKETVDIDKLWQAYQNFGFQIANQHGLLRGDDEAWYLSAGNLFEQNPLYAKVLYVVLAFNAQQQYHKTIAFQQLILLLEKNKTKLELINKLFMKSQQITDIEQVPATVRYRLVDYALSRADLKSAAKLMEKLQQPPEGKDIFDWGLRRARILILGGQYKEGFQILNNLVTADKEITESQIDQYMQVIFDLQNIQQHDLALSAFSKLDQYPLNKKLQREIAYWKAESFQAKAEYEQAAYLYLKSAKPLDNTYDPWYHTASFKAAESLSQAGLIDDARRRYVLLLKITGNAARKAVIRQRLQQLRLQQSKQLQNNSVSEFKRSFAD